MHRLQPVEQLLAFHPGRFSQSIASLNIIVVSALHSTGCTILVRNSTQKLTMWLGFDPGSWLADRTNGDDII
jgi:hypothetical protein